MKAKIGWLGKALFLFCAGRFLLILSALTGLLVREPWSGTGDYPAYQLAIMVLANLIVALLCLYLAKRGGLLIWEKGLFNRNTLLLMVLAFFTKWGLDILGSFWLEHLGTTTTSNQEAVLQLMTSMPTLFILLNGGVVAPIAEELAYRGLLQEKIFGRWPMLGLVLSSLIFAWIHGPKDWPSWLIYGGAGLIYGGLYAKTKNLVYPIALHAVGNLLALSMELVMA